MGKDPRKQMPLEEFVEAGYIQEINRTFLHPIGLALSYETDDDGKPTHIAGVLDSRDDPEGFVFSEFTWDEVKRGDKIRQLQIDGYNRRKELLGFGTQPLVAGKLDLSERPVKIVPERSLRNWLRKLSKGL